MQLPHCITSHRITSHRITIPEEQDVWVGPVDAVYACVLLALRVRVLLGEDLVGVSVVCQDAGGELTGRRSGCGSSGGVVAVVAGAAQEV
jgi:hypothetical protein